MKYRSSCLFIIFAGLFMMTACSQKESDAMSELDINAPLHLDDLEGMFYGFREDVGGAECGGMCWDLYTFLQDDKVLIGVPTKGGPEKIDCTIDECLEYSIQNEQLELRNGESFPIVILDDSLYINDVKLSRVQPVQEGTIFNDVYKNISYFGLIGINAGASSKTSFLTLNANGTYELSGVSIGSIGATSGGTSTHGSPSNDTESGTYEVKGNTLYLTGAEGSVKSLLFFLHDDQINEIQIGEKYYYVDED